MDNQSLKIMKFERMKEAVEFLEEVKTKYLNNLVSEFLKIEDISQLIEYCNKIKTNKSDRELLIPPESIVFFANIYGGLCLFPNENIESHLRKNFRFRDKQLKWFIPFKDILNKIDTINELENIYLDPPFTILIIWIYLSIKIMNTVINEFYEIKKYDGIEQSFMAVELFKGYQNRKNRERSGNKAGKRPFDEFLTDFDNFSKIIIEKLKLNTTSQNFTTKLLTGNIENILIAPLYKDNNISDISTISKRKKQIAFFDLFKLILKDKNWLSEEDFLKLPDGDVPYNGNYENYKANCVKKFIG